MCYSIGSLKVFRLIQKDPPVPEAIKVASIDYVTVMFLPESARNSSTTGGRKLLVGCITLQDISKTQREEIAATQLKLVGSGMQIVGVPVEMEAFQEQSVVEAMQRDPTELLQPLTPIDGGQSSFQMKHLFMATCMNFFLRAPGPSAKRDAAAEYDALLDWAPFSGTAREGAGVTALPIPDEVPTDPRLCSDNMYSGRTRSVKRISRFQKEDWASLAAVSGAACIGSQPLVMRSRHVGCPMLLEHLQERSLAKELMGTLIGVADIATGGELKQIASSSWASVGGGNDVARRRGGGRLVFRGRIL